ncbi:MAG: ATP-binding protein [Bacteroidota bacterium]
MQPLKITPISKLHLLTLLLGLSSSGLWANQQGSTRPFGDLWPRIQVHLQEDGSRRSNLFIEELIQGDCQGSYACLLHQYRHTTEALLRENRFLLAVPVAEAWRATAAEQKDFVEEAEANEKVATLYNYVNDPEKTRATYVDLVRLYEITGNLKRKIMIEVMLVEGLAWHENNFPEAIAGVQQLLRTAEAMDLSEVANEILVRLKYLYEESDYWAGLEAIIPRLEEVARRIDDPSSKYSFHALAGRGDLLRHAGNNGAAAAKYRQALHNIRIEHQGSHDTWSEIYLLHRLADLAWEQRQVVQAQSYLDTVYALADAFDMHDRILITQDLRIKIAEAQGHYQDALYALREKQYRQAILDSISVGFDLRRHDLERNLREIKMTQEQQSLTLQSRNNQLKTTLIISFLVALACILLAWGLLRQRSARLELARRNQLISEQAQQLRQLDKAKSRFFANISHELRTPLTLVLGPLRSLRRQQDRLEKQQRQHIELANQGAENLKNLVDELFKLTKLEAGKLQLAPQPTALRPFFVRYLSQFTSLAERREITYRYTIDAPAEQWIALDREKCRQMLFNLLSNAFKFTTPGDQVTAEVSYAAGQLQMVVTDTGPGIHPADLPQIFDRFFQTSRPDTTATGGTGIGLALSHQYAELFGGTITASSDFGKGARFHVRLPVATVAADEVPLPTETLSARSPKSGDPVATPVSVRTASMPERPHLLIAEDNENLQQYLRSVLEPTYAITIAQNGSEAWLLLQAQAKQALPFSLIISDLMMPIMDGYQLLQKVKSTPGTQQLPFIMLTARAEREDRLQALRVGVDDYLIKPFDEEELRVRIQNLLTNHAVRQQIQVEENSAADRPTLAVPDQEWLERFEGFVRAHLSSRQLNVSSLCQEFAMSESTLARQLKRLVGLPPKKYIREIQLDVARELLESRRYKTVGRVGVEVGYTDVRTFSRNFHQRFGTRPADLL